MSGDLTTCPSALPKPMWKQVVLIGWLTGIGTVIAWLLLRPSPSATGLPLTPHWLIAWLNIHHDLRTLPMAWGYAIIPALTLGDQPHKRRRCLLLILAFLLAGEVAQLFIPTRSFTWMDVIFSILGVLIAELIVLTMSMLRPHQPFLKNG